MKNLWLLLCLSVSTALAQTHTTVTVEDNQTITGAKTFIQLIPISYTFAALPAPSSVMAGTEVNITDSNTAGSCTAGGLGSNLVKCRASGTAGGPGVTWQPIGGGGGGGGNVFVNGSLINNANFNNTTPAAGTNSALMTFNVSGSNISASIGAATTSGNLGLAKASVCPSGQHANGNFNADGTMVCSPDTGSGGGSTVSVNGLSMPSANFGLTPAAPTNAANVTYAVSGSNVSAYIAAAGANLGLTKSGVCATGSHANGGYNADGTPSCSADTGGGGGPAVPPLTSTNPNPATAGLVRAAPTDQGLCFMNAALTGNICISKDTSDDVSMPSVALGLGTGNAGYDAFGAGVSPNLSTVCSSLGASCIVHFAPPTVTGNYGIQEHATATTGIVRHNLSGSTETEVLAELSGAVGTAGTNATTWTNTSSCATGFHISQITSAGLPVCTADSGGTGPAGGWTQAGSLTSTPLTAIVGDATQYVPPMARTHNMTMVQGQAPGIFAFGVGPDGDHTGTIWTGAISSSSISLPAGVVPAGDLTPGTVGQCVTTVTGPSSAWGSCAGTAGSQVVTTNDAQSTLAAASTAIQNWSTVTPAAGQFNTIGRHFRVTAFGIISAVTPGTTTFRLFLNIGGSTVEMFQSSGIASTGSPLVYKITADCYNYASNLFNCFFGGNITPEGSMSTSGMTGQNWSPGISYTSGVMGFAIEFSSASTSNQGIQETLVLEQLN